MKKKENLFLKTKTCVIMLMMKALLKKEKIIEND
jgi:hypothetical protein